MLFPATACIVQDKLGATRAWAFDISAACSGFIYALTMGAQFIESGAHRKVLVIGADVMTSILDYKDRATCVLFGDGAGAVLLEPSDDETGILDFHHEVDGSRRAGTSTCWAGAACNPTTHETVDRRHALHPPGRPARLQVRGAQDGRGSRCTSSSGTASRPKRWTCSSPHQANVRIIDAAQQRLGLPDSKVVKNIDRYGNTTAATIPLALGTALDDGRLKPGSLVVMTSVGAGFTVGSVLVRWSSVPWN